MTYFMPLLKPGKMVSSPSKRFLMRWGGTAKAPSTISTRKAKNVDTDDMSVSQATAILNRKAREVMEKEMRPDGYVMKLYPSSTSELPGAELRMWANGTWEWI